MVYIYTFSFDVEADNCVIIIIIIYNIANIKNVDIQSFLHYI